MSSTTSGFWTRLWRKNPEAALRGPGRPGVEKRRRICSIVQIRLRFCSLFAGGRQGGACRDGGPAGSRGARGRGHTGVDEAWVRDRGRFVMPLRRGREWVRVETTPSNARRYGRWRGTAGGRKGRPYGVDGSERGVGRRGAGEPVAGAIRGRTERGCGAAGVGAGRDDAERDVGRAAPLRRFATPLRLAVPENPIGLSLILGIFDRCGNSGFASPATGSAKPQFPDAGRGKENVDRS